jgi:hypothetical protein
MLKTHLLNAYLDYVNNFLSAERFAEHYGISLEMARLIISEMKEYNESLSEIKKRNK